MKKKLIIAPSILACDVANIQDEVCMINESEAEWIHFDVMDGRFVPNITFGIPVCAALSNHKKKKLDVHLMIVEPEKYIDSFVSAGADSISVHFEACHHLHGTIQKIKAHSILAGVAINPHTSVMLLENTLPEVDFVNIMSVNPGFGGQEFIQNSLKRVAQVRKMADEMGLETMIEVDGGMTLKIAKKCIAAGANILVAGSFVFSAADPKAVISQLKKLA